jgi:hypothetical protein
MTRGVRTWAAAGIAAGCVAGAVAARRTSRRPPPAAAPVHTVPDRIAAPVAAATPRVAPPAVPARRRGMGMWGTAAVAISIVVAAATVVTVASTQPSTAATVPIASPLQQTTPGVPAYHLVVPKVAPLAHHTTWRYAQVLRHVRARTRPGGRAIAALRTRTPEHTVNIVLITATRMHRGRLWVRVRLPVLPNGTQGWVLRSALSGYTFVDTHLVISLRHRSLTLYRAGRAIFRAPVGIGAKGTPTPRGQFYIRDRLRGYASPFYGPIAFGTSARSAVLTEWPAGGYIGIHGTNAPQLIPGRPSHGCIRMRDRALLRLARLLPVGTPVTIG